ncbi:hypothetical protein [Peteryoungia ipomoeae]|uniref:Uncharacterized protein n=1 Tax=Peteryoungia ipomoeae TaxID=1210932 RepID=A0A4S8NSX6_9HYPH|nr:hypothetical protein [Peteryoungia ipomoeae]THV20547.1 hypothetical protein FAA97_18280 [Peteryoungia ipomoeae]
MDRAIRIILALLLILVGLSHQPPAGLAVAAPHDVAAYVLPDGTVPELCVSMDDRDGQHHDATFICDACLIASALLLPEPTDRVGRRMVAALKIEVRQHDDTGYRREFSPNTAPRAPPVPDSI